MISKNKILLLLFSILLLTGCSSSDNMPVNHSYRIVQGNISDPVFSVNSLRQHQRNWRGTPYRLGGSSRKGIDCSAFMQLTFRELFGIQLPRTTVEQAKVGTKISKNALRTGDLVFFKTGRGPNGRHVGVYVKDGQFLHASTKGGVVYSDIHSPYWSKRFWQARRL